MHVEKKSVKKSREIENVLVIAVKERLFPVRLQINWSAV